MIGKRILCTILAIMVTASCLCMNVAAVESTGTDMELLAERASGKFTMKISANSIKKASSSFPLEAGETVTIKASYAPFSAKVDFGLVGPDGLFRYVTVDDGSIDQTIGITQRGYYTLAVRNNSSQAIDVSGYVNY